MHGVMDALLHPTGAGYHPSFLKTSTSLPPPSCACQHCTCGVHVPFEYDSMHPTLQAKSSD